MTDDIGVNGQSEVGECQVLVSNGDQNHPPRDYALATARTILPVDGLGSEYLIAAGVMHGRVEAVLAPFFAKVIDKQKANLASNPTDFSLSHEIHGIALEAAGLVQEIVQSSFVAHVVSRLGWLEEITKVIATNLATACHVENLLHADRNPEMPEAKAYKQIQG